MESFVVDKGKDIFFNGNIFDRDVDGSRCGSENFGGNYKLFNSSFDMFFVVIFILLRIFYVVSLYIVVIYVFYLFGIYYFLVVFYLFVVFLFVEVKGVCLNLFFNGYMVVLNCMRMGSF